jgi:aldose 1-epimerase
VSSGARPDRLGLGQTFTLSNDRGLEVDFIAYGGRIVSVRFPDRDGRVSDIAPGYDSLADYARDTMYLGAIVGRYANRIAHSRFTLDGVEHSLVPNEGDNQLHGGPGGFHQVIWNVEPFPNALRGATLTYESPAGDQGFPGALTARVTYIVTQANELVVEYQATVSEATPVNLTQHTYFNLAGHDSGDILDHELTLVASRYTPVSADLIPTGAIEPVAGTPFDFTNPRRIGDGIHSRHEQIVIGSGYDHNFVLDRADGGELSPAAELYEQRSGRMLEIFTSEPGIQFYSGSGFGRGPHGKHGYAYDANAALALETQHFPDSPNQPQFPSTIVRPGQEYKSVSVYRFSVR